MLVMAISFFRKMRICTVLHQKRETKSNIVREICPHGFCEICRAYCFLINKNNEIVFLFSWYLKQWTITFAILFDFAFRCALSFSVAFDISIKVSKFSNLQNVTPDHFFQFSCWNSFYPICDVELHAPTCK